MTTDKNRFVAERLGLCWHEWDWREASQTYRCTKCGAYLMDIPVPTNPAFDSDAGIVQLLRLMRGRDDWSEFVFEIGWKATDHRKDIHCVEVPFITTPGALLEAVAAWLGWEEK